MKTWWKEAIGYQIVPKTFFDSNADGIGDLPGITAKLDYLKELGVDLIWIGPFFKSPMDDNGYDVSDYFDVNPMFGTLDDAKTLVKEAHKRKIHVILDLVLNHTSDEHPWFIEARNHPDSEEHDYYIWRQPRFDAEGHRLPPTNWSSFFSDSAWAFDEQTGQYYMKIFSRKMPDLNWANPKLREKMEAIARWWLDLGIDGFRVDAVAHLARDTRFEDSEMPLDAQGNAPDWSKFSNLPALFDYLAEFKETVLDRYDCMSVGEVGGGAPPETALKYAGYQEGPFNMVFTFDHCWCNGLSGREDITDEDRYVDVIALKKTFDRWYQGLHGKAWPAVYWMNHDQPRVVSQYGDPLTYHDESAKMLCATLYLMYGTPFVFNGEEIGMTNVDYTDIHDFHDIWVANYYEAAKDRLPLDQIVAYQRRTSRVNARTPMQWSAEAHAGFSETEPAEKVIGNYKKINVADQLADENSVLQFYRRTFKLRKSRAYKELFVYGEFELLENSHPDVFAYRRFNAAQEVIVVSNFRNVPVVYPVELHRKKLLLSNYPDYKYRQGQLHLRPYESLVIRKLK